MAVFSGGRWIRAQLEVAGDGFWRAGASIDVDNHNEDEKGGEQTLASKELSLWNFDGEHDGEDIKAEFKRRLAGAEDLFTDDERIDVIEEAKQIFKFSASLVEELDQKLGTDMESLARAERTEKANARVKSKVDQATSTAALGSKVSQSAVMWLRRPEVTGTMVALGCLACVALITLDARIFL
jgi:hypothetical protein